jgi:hypothetical protein
MALLKFKRSAVSGKAPTLADLGLGELAINTFDGKLYMRKDNGTASIIEVGGGSGVLSFNTRTGAVTLSSGDVTTALGYTPPQPNGTGASGTWGISITGNAATVSNITRANSGNVDINTLTTSGFYRINAAETNRPGDYGQMLTVYGGSDTIGQLYFDYGTGDIISRAGNPSNVGGSGSWSAWKRNLNATNYTNYAMPSGSSATNSVDVRAPIFYDSNNTGYYVDPASTSNLNALTIASGSVLGAAVTFNNMNNAHSTYTDANLVGDFGFRYLQGATNGPAISGASQYYGMTLGLGNNYGFDGYASQFYWPRAAIGGLPYPSVRFKEGGTWSAWSKIYAGWADAPSGATFTATGDFRAPIFYDSNNTGFYLDPASRSKLSNITVASGGVESGIRFRGDTLDFVGRYSDYVSLFNANGPEFKLFDSGYAYLNVYGENGASWRAPIFYDSNNTGYYIDAASTSNLRGLTITDGSAAMTFSSTSSGRSAAFGMTDSYNMYLNAPSGGILFLSSFQAPIMYDRDNSAYYVDPHSTTNINVLNVAGGNVVKGDSEQGRSTNSGNMNSLADPSGFYFAMSPTGAPNAEWYNWINCMGNSWGGTDRYGFQIAHQFWSANEFYVRRVQSGGWQAWDRIFTTGSNDVRSPIFYDRDDTSYYANPNGTSRLSSIALGGASAVYQGVFWAAGDLWIDGNSRKIAFTTDGSTDNGGNVSIFAVGNDFRINNWSGSALNDNFYVFGASRDAACAGNITAYYSDDRLKTKTGTITDALGKVASLEGFTYVENETARSVGYANDRQQVGVSAQAVQAVLPEAVHLAPFDYDVAEDGTIKSKSGEDYLTVDYSRIVPLLIEAIKELTNKVETLEANIRSK